MPERRDNLPADVTGLPRSPREEQRRRNAAARRKLERLDEHKRLLAQLTDVWDEDGKAR